MGRSQTLSLVDSVLQPQSELSEEEEQEEEATCWGLHHLEVLLTRHIYAPSSLSLTLFLTGRYKKLDLKSSASSAEQSAIRKDVPVASFLLGRARTHGNLGEPLKGHSLVTHSNHATSSDAACEGRGDTADVSLRVFRLTSSGQEGPRCEERRLWIDVWYTAERLQETSWINSNHHDLSCRNPDVRTACHNPVCQYVKSSHLLLQCTLSLTFKEKETSGDETERDRPHVGEARGGVGWVQQDFDPGPVDVRSETESKHSVLTRSNI